MNTSLHHLFRVACLSMAIVLAISADAQQASGLYHEHYAGVHGVVKNPAFGQHGGLTWDVNIGSANLYGRTDYVGVANSNFFTFLGALDSLNVLGLNGESFDPSARGILFSDQNRNSSGFVHIDLMGPSFWLDLDLVGVGLFLRGRIEAGVAHIPAILGYDQYPDLSFGEVQSITNLQSAGAAWTEYGVNISSDAFGDGDISLGVNIKYLQGHEGYYLHSPNNFDFTRIVNNQFEINSSASSLAYTDGFGNEQSLSRTNRGYGWAVDLGYSQTFKRSKIGVSLLDLGSIRFNNSGSLHRLVTNETLTIDLVEFYESGSIEDIVNLVDQASMDSTLVSNSFSVRTPARLIVNYDYQLAKKFFVNTSMSHRIASTENAIKSENNLSISPRYESRWFAASAPVVLNNYESVHVGLAARFGFLTIGSDDILSLFGSDYLNGISIYASIKINPIHVRKEEIEIICP